MTNINHNQKNDVPIYSSRIVDTYLRLIRLKYSFIDEKELLNYAKMKPYQAADPGHWFTQNQINRFHEKLSLLTNNKNIAREAGRFAASPKAIGAVRQYALGMFTPAKVYQKITKFTSHFTRSALYSARKLSNNKVEIIVKLKPGVQEQQFQCENRIGFWEAITVVFNLKSPEIEHPECIFKGDKVCRYIISLDPPQFQIWRKIRNIFAVFSLAGFAFCCFINLSLAIFTVLPTSIAILLGISNIAGNFEKIDLKTSLFNLKDPSDKLLQQIDTNYNNAQLTSEISQAAAGSSDIKEVASKIAKIAESRLNYDRALILLANQDKTRLKFGAGFGYSENKMEIIHKSDFHLDKPDSKGVFVVSFRQQKPFLVNDIEEIGQNLSKRSQFFAKKMQTQSFICCPIICDDKSLGVLAVDNLRTKKPLVESDLSLLIGVAHIIGISIRNARLNEARKRQFTSMLQVLAASIDARDPLTAGHSEKVTKYSMGICEEMKLDKEYREMIRVAALLHDYGKIGVPDSILKKPGRLTRKEYEIVKTHAEKTRILLEQINFEGNLSRVPLVAASHHEKNDGSGYPLGLKRDQIPLGSRIIAVADFFEAITSKRHYRGPMLHQEAFSLLKKESELHFDTEIVEAFTRYYAKIQPEEIAA